MLHCLWTGNGVESGGGAASGPCDKWSRLWSLLSWAVGAGDRKPLKLGHGRWLNRPQTVWPRPRMALHRERKDPGRNTGYPNTLSTLHNMLLNCGVGEDSESPWDSKEIKPVNPKGNQPWILIGRIDAEAPILLPPDVKSWLIVKDPDAGKDWRQEEKGTTEDEMVGWHHWLNGHEFEQTLGDSEGQGSLVCCSPWGCKELDKTERLHNNNTLSPFLCLGWDLLLGSVSKHILFWRLSSPHRQNCIINTGTHPATPTVNSWPPLHQPHPYLLLPSIILKQISGTTSFHPKISQHTSLKDGRATNAEVAVNAQNQMSSYLRGGWISIPGFLNQDPPRVTEGGPSGIFLFNFSFWNNFRLTGKSQK